MTLYDIVYNFFKDYLFNNTAIDGYEFEIFNTQVKLSEWLSHTTTIIGMALVILFFIKLIIYFSKWFGGLFKF